MASKNHTHRYRRVNLNGPGKDEYWVMHCNLDNCTHYIPMHSKLSAPRLKGVKALCNKCGDAFSLDRRALRMAEPICFSCVDRKNLTDTEKMEKFFKELGKSV